MDSILAICIPNENWRCFTNQTYLCIPSTTRGCCCQHQSKLYSGQDASRTKQQTALRNNCCCAYCPMNNIDGCSRSSTCRGLSRFTSTTHFMTTYPTSPSTTACAFAARLRRAFARTCFISGCSSKKTAEWLKPPTREEAHFPTSVLQKGGVYSDEAPPT